jgi:hypothetical protein
MCISAVQSDSSLTIEAPNADPPFAIDFVEYLTPS